MKKMKLNIQLFASGESSVFTDSPLQMKMKWSSKPSESVSNASDVTCEIYGRRTSGSTKGRQWNGYMNIGGNIHNFSQIYTKTSTTVGTSWVLMAYYTDTIVHDSDGTKTITIYGGLGGPSGTSIANNWCEGSTTAILDQLASPATLNSVDITNFVSQGKFTPNFTINQGGLYYGMYIIAYTPSQTIVSWNSPIAVSNGVEATLTDAQKQTLWNYLDERENRTAVDIMFVLASYSDSSLSGDYQIGTSDIHFQNTIAIPDYSLNWDWNTTTIYDANDNVYYGGHPLSYYKAGNKYVKSLSKPVVSFAATSSTGYLYGKTITYTLNGVARTSPYEDTSWNGETTYTLTASDGRASSITTTISINVVNYFIPYLSNIRVVRPIPTDDVVRVSYTANYYDGTGLSYLSSAGYNFYYRESESDAWTFVSTLSGTSTSGSQAFSNIDIDNLNYKKPFYYKIEFWDRIGNAMAVNPYTSSIPKGLPVWNAYVDSNDTNVLNVNGKLEIDDDNSATISNNGEIFLRYNSSNSAVLSSNGRELYLRPNGTSSSLGQAILYTNGNLNVSGGISTAGVYTTGNIDTQGNDLILGSYPNTNDTGDIMWKYLNNNEKTRIWFENSLNGLNFMPNFRAFNENGGQIFSGKLLVDRPLEITTQNILQLEPGFYLKEGSDGWTENGWPVATWHATLWVWGSSYGTDYGWRTLICVDNSNNEIWLRSQQWSSWSNWKKIG